MFVANDSSDSDTAVYIGSPVMCGSPVQATVTESTNLYKIVAGFPIHALLHTIYGQHRKPRNWYSAPLLKSKLFQYHSALVGLQQSSALTHQCGRFLTSFTSNDDIISRRKSKTAIRIFKT